MSPFSRGPNILPTPKTSLKRQLGFAAVAAIVIGDMLGSGIFFTPGQLASVAQANWQVYFFWSLCGFITLCGALTLAELSTQFPFSGSSYHIIGVGFGPFWAFLKIWVEMWISGPGSVAGVAIVFGTFLATLIGGKAILWGISAIGFFTILNLLGVRWGGRTQIVLTSVKIIALLALIAGSLFSSSAVQDPAAKVEVDLGGFFRLIGLGVAAVLFTYDGWTDVTHVAGEVSNPRKVLPAGLAGGVGTIVLLYLAVNYTFLRIVPLAQMRAQPTLVATHVANVAFGNSGGRILSAVMMISIFGALGGLMMTEPRLYFAAASEYQERNPNRFFSTLAFVSKSAVPAGSIIFCALTSIAVVLVFGTFSRIANFFVISFQLVNILMVASIYKTRRNPDNYQTPGYPITPAIFIGVISLLLLSAVYYNPRDSLIGATLTALSFPVYVWLNRSRKK
jgi:basic amino acid/polyamine antiporter, APA family